CSMVCVCYTFCIHVCVFHALCLCTCVDSVCYIHCVCARVCVLHSMSYVLCACTGLGVTLCDKCFLCAHAWLLHSVLHAVCVGYTVHTCGYYTPCVTRCGCAHVWVLHSVCYTVCMCASVWVLHSVCYMLWGCYTRSVAACTHRAINPLWVLGGGKLVSYTDPPPGCTPGQGRSEAPRRPGAAGRVRGTLGSGVVAFPLAAPQPWGWVGWCRAQFSHRPLCLLGPWWGRATNPAGEGGGRACMGTARDVGGIRIEIWGV
uniref:Uncharacterized protein n=1 Tax=Terrapene triunguis TaxID=2587831 RepID=A0A674J5Y0_9SAUR